MKTKQIQLFTYILNHDTSLNYPIINFIS